LKREHLVYVLVAVCLAAGSVLTVMGVRTWQARSAATAKTQAVSRSAREAPALDVAPAPLPTSLPLLGADDRDGYGYPTRYVNRPALRSLLFHGRHAELTRYFEELQAAFEEDPTKEYWPMDAADTFASAEPALEAALTAWVGATPKSFAPYLARGSHLLTSGYTRRGGKFAADTPASDFAAMNDAFARALADLDRALTLRPKLVAALREKIKIHTATSARAESKAAIDRAVGICPPCFQVRVAYIFGLTPKWGGSHREMLAFADASLGSGNPKAKLLRGYADLSQAEEARRAERLDAAKDAADRACALGDHWEFLVERAEIAIAQKRLADAARDLDRALELRPGAPRVSLVRAFVAQKQGNSEAAARDLLDGLRVDPTDKWGKATLPSVVKGLIREGWKHHEAGRRAEALRVYDLAAELAPTNPEVQGRRATIVGGKPPTDERIAALEQAAREKPDDFRAHQELDYALAKQGKLDRVIALWTDFVARQPGEGRAYLERGGAYYRLGKMKEARDDVAKACSLGLNEGCARSKQFGAP
jgi:tetratricopeptide (TPR) repeat protein